MAGGGDLPWGRKGKHRAKYHTDRPSQNLPILHIAASQNCRQKPDIWTRVLLHQRSQQCQPTCSLTRDRLNCAMRTNILSLGFALALNEHR